MIHRYLLKIIVIGLIALAAVEGGAIGASGEPKWVTYRSPTSFYSVDHPQDWRVTIEGNIVSITPGDQSGAVTISAYIGKLEPGDGERLISRAFATHQPTSPLQKVTGPGWQGIRRTFLVKSNTPNLEAVAIIATNADGMVFITSNEALPRIAERAPVYGRILESLRLSTPKRR